MKRARRTELNRIRRALVEEYNRLGEILMEDTATDIHDPPKEQLRPDCVDISFRFVSHAINAINLELGRPKDS